MSFATAGMMGRPIPPSAVPAPQQNFSRSELLDYRQGQTSGALQPHPFAYNNGVATRSSMQELLQARTPESRRNFVSQAPVTSNDMEMHQIQQLYAGTPARPIRSTATPAPQVASERTNAKKIGANVDMEALSKKTTQEYFRNTKLSNTAKPLEESKVSVRVSKTMDPADVSKQLVQLTKAIQDLKADVDANKSQRKMVDKLASSLSDLKSVQDEQLKLTEEIGDKIVAQDQVNKLVVEKMEKNKSQISFVENKLGANNKFNNTATKAVLRKVVPV